MKNFLIVIGILATFVVLLVLGCCALTVHDSDLLHQHPSGSGSQTMATGW